jgi:hypothetical protein
LREKRESPKKFEERKLLSGWIWELISLILMFMDLSSREELNGFFTFNYGEKVDQSLESVFI